MKKLLALVLALFMVFSIVGCDNDDTKTESNPVSAPQDAVSAKKIETAEDLVGVWRVEQPWPENEIKEFGEELGLENFKTTALYEWYIELHNDGTTTYVIDYELNKQSREKSYYTVFYEAFSEARKVLPEDEFMSLVEESNGYSCYKKLLDENTINNYTDSEHYEGYKEFLKTANAEMKKYSDSPIEEQAAIGAMWGELLEDVGTRFVYKNGEWQALASVSYGWSFEDGIFRYYGMKHEIEGNTETFAMDGDFFKDSTWTRIK